MCVSLNCESTFWDDSCNFPVCLQKAVVGKVGEGMNIIDAIHHDEILNYLGWGMVSSPIDSIMTGCNQF